MQTKIKEITPEVIKLQKEAVIKEIATAQLHLEFHQQRFDAMKPKTKEEKETIAHQKLQTTNPLMDNIKLKTAYYEFLCGKE